jgi:hypothetical protein
MPPPSEGFAAQSRMDSAKTTGSPRFKVSADAAAFASKKCCMVVMLPAGNRSGAYRERKPFQLGIWLSQFYGRSASHSDISLAGPSKSVLNVGVIFVRPISPAPVLSWVLAFLTPSGSDFTLP